MKNLAIPGIIVGVLFYAICVFFAHPFAGAAFAVAFSSFDVSLWMNAGIGQSKPEFQGWYRWAQNETMILLLLFAFVIGGWPAALSGFLFWWLGGCDMLYYVIGTAPLDSGWFWLWWTPVGLCLFIPNLFRMPPKEAREKVEISTSVVLFQALIGLLLLIGGVWYGYAQP